MFARVRADRRVGVAALLVIAALAMLIAHPLAGQAQEPGVAVGELPPQGGIAVVRWGGGTIGELEEAVPAATSFWVTHDGTPVSYIPSAPAFVNARFHALFPDGQLSPQPVIVVLPRVETPLGFDRRGTLVRDQPGMPAGVWYLLYEAPGAPALSVQVEFTATSACTSLEEPISCAVVEHGDRVHIRGVQVGDSVRVYALELLPPEGAAAVEIECHVAYRVATTEPLTEVHSFWLGNGDSTRSVPYIYLELHAEYASGADGSERSLRLWVTPTAEDDVIVTQLFQLSKDDGLVNQFLGGHGFTGLTYAYDPVSGAELQYWCEAA